MYAKYLPMQVEICEEEASVNTPEVSSFWLFPCHCGSLLADFCPSVGFAFWQLPSESKWIHSHVFFCFLVAILPPESEDD